jgi:hypothetical protein
VSVKRRSLTGRQPRSISSAGFVQVKKWQRSFHPPDESLDGGGEVGDLDEAEPGFVAEPWPREPFDNALQLMRSPGRLPLLSHCSREGTGPGG